MPSGSKKKPKSRKDSRPPARKFAGLLDALPTRTSGRELAVLFNIAPRTLRELAKNGVIERAESQDQYLTLDSIQGYLEHLRKQASGRATKTGLNLADERALTERVLREQAQWKLGETQKRLLSVEDVRDGWTRIGAIFKTSALSLPTKISVAVPSLTPHDRETVKKLVREMLEDVGATLEGVPGSTPGDLTPDAE